MHNFLLEEDGLNEGWDVNRYLGNEGNHKECDSHQHFDGAAFGVAYDSSGIGPGIDLIATYSIHSHQEVCDVLGSDAA